MTNQMIFLFLIAVFLGTAIDVGSTQKSECDEDEDCIHPNYNKGGKCKNHFCIGKYKKNVLKNCSAVEIKPKQIVQITKINCSMKLYKFYNYDYEGSERCNSTLDCARKNNWTDIMCIQGQCDCISGHDRVYRMTCIEDKECYHDKDCRRPHYKEVGKCQNNFCICKDEKDVLKNCSVAVEMESKQIDVFEDPFWTRCWDTQECTGGIPWTDPQCENGQCVCQAGYHLADRTTCIEKKNIGAECNRDDECNYRYNVRCYDRKCNCSEDRILSSDGQKCELKAREEYDHCFEDVQCASLAGTSCTNMQCRCPETHRYIESRSKCIPYKIIGEDCKTHDECNSAWGVHCYGRCGCSADQILSLNGQKCLGKVEKMYDLCDDERQCTSLVAGSNCTRRTCQCPDNHHYNKTLSSCILNKNIDEACSHDHECSHHEEYKYAICMNGVCTECSPYCVLENGECVDSGYNGYCSHDYMCSAQNEEKDNHTLCVNGKCRVCDANCFRENIACHRVVQGASYTDFVILGILISGIGLSLIGVWLYRRYRYRLGGGLGQVKFSRRESTQPLFSSQLFSRELLALDPNHLKTESAGI